MSSYGNGNGRNGGNGNGGRYADDFARNCRIIEAEVMEQFDAGVKLIRREIGGVAYQAGRSVARSWGLGNVGQGLVGIVSGTAAPAFLRYMQREGGELREKARSDVRLTLQTVGRLRGKKEEQRETIIGDSFYGLPVENGHNGNVKKGSNGNNGHHIVHPLKGSFLGGSTFTSYTVFGRYPTYEAVLAAHPNSKEAVGDLRLLWEGLLEGAEKVTQGTGTTYDHLVRTGIGPRESDALAALEKPLIIGERLIDKLEKKPELRTLVNAPFIKSPEFITPIARAAVRVSRQVMQGRIKEIYDN